MLIMLDLRMGLVKGGVSGILTAGHPDVNQPLLIKVVTKHMGWVRKQLQRERDREREREREGRKNVSEQFHYIQ